MVFYYAKVLKITRIDITTGSSCKLEPTEFKIPIRGLYLPLFKGGFYRGISKDEIASLRSQ